MAGSEAHTLNRDLMQSFLLFEVLASRLTENNNDVRRRRNFEAPEDKVEARSDTRKTEKERNTKKEDNLAKC